MKHNFLKKLFVLCLSLTLAVQPVLASEVLPEPLIEEDEIIMEESSGANESASMEETTIIEDSVVIEDSSAMEDFLIDPIESGIQEAETEDTTEAEMEDLTEEEIEDTAETGSLMLFEEEDPQLDASITAVSTKEINEGIYAVGETFETTPSHFGYSDTSSSTSSRSYYIGKVYIDSGSSHATLSSQTVTFTSAGSVTMKYEIKCRYIEEDSSVGPVTSIVAYGYSTFDVKNIPILTESMVTVDSAEYNGKGLTPSVKITVDGTTIPSTDYTVGYSNNKNVGKGVAWIDLRKSSLAAGHLHVSFDITPIDLSKHPIYLGQTSYTYNGIPKEPTASIGTYLISSTGTTTLVPDENYAFLSQDEKDYTVSYTKNINAGTATVTLCAGTSGKTTGSRSTTFVINKQSLRNLSLSMSTDPLYYSGSAQEPTIDIGKKFVLIGKSYRARSLTRNLDYKLTFTDNVLPGTATVTIQGVGNFKDTLTRTFTIEKCPIDKKEIILSKTSMVYTGKAMCPTVTVEDLVENQDYTLTYKNNVKVGTAEVVIQGIGNYTGEVTKTFTITKATMNLSIRTSSKSVRYSKVKNSAQVLSALTMKGVKENATVTFVKKSGSSKLTIDAATGKIKVKKGTKKGTYSIKVKATAAATSNYKKATTTKTIQVTVKSSRR